MKKFILIASVTILSFGIINETSANTISCINGVREDGVTKCEKCGDKCNWSFDSEGGKLSVFGSGDMYTRKYQEVNGVWGYQTDDGKEVPWNQYMKQITFVSVDGVNNIGSYSFMGSNVSDYYIGDSVKEIEGCAFCSTKLTSAVIPDSITRLDWGVFSGNDLSYVIVPDTLMRINDDSFGRDKEKLLNLKITCKGNVSSCEELMKKLENYTYYDEEKAKIEKFPLKNISYAKESQCNGNYYWSGKSCNNKKNGINCAENWKRNEDFCNRIRYTPAEAAEVLHDDNTNEVTITFKK